MTGKQFSPFTSLLFLTNRVGRLLANQVRRRSKIMGENGLHPQHIGVMVDLWMKDGLRQQDLAISTIKDKGTIARSLKQLEQKNFLVRIPDEKDKRNKRIYLTHKGRELKTTLAPFAEKIIQEAIEDIPKQKVEVCKEVLLALYHRLNQ